MAHRHRDVISNISERENVHTRVGKPRAPKLPTAVGRAALKDIENKDVKKDEEKKQPKVEVLKKAPSFKSYSSQSLDIVDPDVDCKNEPQMVTEYLGDIFDYLRELQDKYPVKETFLVGHKSTPRMRSILVNWLVQVHSNFQLCLETLHLTISILDRYLQANKLIGRESLQLVGTAALLVACKYEEIYLPPLSDFAYICDKVFTQRQILRTERDILRVLDFHLGKPISILFLRRYSKIGGVKPDQHTFAKYILEQALLDHKFSHINPSTQAAAACCLAITVTTTALTPYPAKHWTPTLEHYTKHTYNDLKSTVQSFANMILSVETTKYLAVYNKYQASAHSKISLLPKTKHTVVKKLAEGWPKS